MYCYKRLAAEMYVDGITKKDLAILLGKSKETISKKLNGVSDFTNNEVALIMNTYFKGDTVEHIFLDK